MPAVRCGIDLTLMTLPLTGIRKARLSTLSVLLASCVFISGASAQQASDAAKAKPATTTSAAKPDSTKAAASTTKSAGAAHPTSSAHHSSRRKRPARVRGQKKIDADRARTIQEALIREHYLTGEPAGTWNQASEDAMRRYQSDHGWQTIEVPDSRALISLGLGPSKDHLLNPESAMTTGPQTRPATSPTTSPAVAPAASPASASPNAPAPTPVPAPSSGQDPSSPQ
ncbi:MAG: peptidoglycan-binding domain-containing protein [Candidatus Sulfotelmatobacter sp.]